MAIGLKEFGYDEAIISIDLAYVLNAWGVKVEPKSVTFCIVLIKHVVK